MIYIYNIIFLYCISLYYIISYRFWENIAQKIPNLQLAEAPFWALMCGAQWAFRTPVPAIDLDVKYQCLQIQLWFRAPNSWFGASFHPRLLLGGLWDTSRYLQMTRKRNINSLKVKKQSTPLWRSHLFLSGGSVQMQWPQDSGTPNRRDGLVWPKEFGEKTNTWITWMPFCPKSLSEGCRFNRVHLMLWGSKSWNFIAMMSCAESLFRFSSVTGCTALGVKAVRDVNLPAASFNLHFCCLISDHSSCFLLKITICPFWLQID